MQPILRLDRSCQTVYYITTQQNHYEDHDASAADLEK